ncbi:MAG: shikimate dehydrogenase [Desulfovibrionales bacterium]|nr:shikimate dehydrogenase [Desulfovibrionales bacterium]
MKLFGIIGHPLAHTLSPVLHNWAFRELDVQASYHVWDTPPQKLPAFMAALRTLPIHGLSVTIPHKETVIPMVDELAENARLIGAVNTLFWQNGKLWGDNTDVTGFMAPLLERGIKPGTALILGAGGAARAALCGLHKAGWTVCLSARTQTRADRLALSFQADHVAWSERHTVRPDLLVNTTPLGMSGPFQSLSPWKDTLHGISLVYDLVYNPRQTPLLAQAERERVEILHGLPMFVGQGLAQFERWTGLRFDFAQALALLEQTLGTKIRA